MTSQKSLNSSQSKKQKRSNLATTIVIPAISHHLYAQFAPLFLLIIYYI